MKNKNSYDYEQMIVMMGHPLLGASLGHKANHASPPENNCVYLRYDSHPVFGRIKCLRSVKKIKQNEEILVDYGYEANDVPEWWTSTSRKRKLETITPNE